MADYAYEVWRDQMTNVWHEEQPEAEQLKLMGVGGVDATYVTPGDEWWKQRPWSPQPERWDEPCKCWPGTSTTTTLTTNVGRCEYCDGYHRSLTCVRIKSIEYHENGTVKRVELKD